MFRVSLPWPRLRIAAFAGLALIPFAPIQADGTQDANTAKLMGAGLIAIGGIDLATHSSECTSMSWACARVALDVAAIGGGIYALLQNTANAQQTSATAMPSASGNTTTNPGTALPTELSASNSSFSSPSSSQSTPQSVQSACEQAPSICSCNDPSCSQPKITLPPIDTLKGLVTQGFKGQPTLADGTTLASALTNLDDAYKKTAGAADAFNAKSADGGFGGAPSTDSMIAGASDNSGGGGGGSGLQSGKVDLASVSGTEGGLDGSESGLSSLVKDIIKQRDPPAAVKATGLNLEDARTGRILTIWERLTRALRGPHDRDILLAKMEWTRHEALRRMGHGLAKPIDHSKSNFAISREKP